MNKFAIFAIMALSLTACDKLGSGGGSHSQFVKMCKDDPRAREQGFDCSCQADIISAVLKGDEMDKLINFLNVQKEASDKITAAVSEADKTKAKTEGSAKVMELGNNAEYAPMFQKIGNIGMAIHDKCGNPNAPAPAPAAAAGAKPAPTAGKPAPAKAAKAPAVDYKAE